jgi:beta-lactamase regulating signal transducer with metallopeptidase domain
MDILNILFEITVFSGVIFAATMLLKACLKRRMSPLLHYAVWFVLVLRLVTPVTIASPVRLFVVPAAPQSAPAPQAEPQSYQPPGLPDTGEADTAGTQPQPYVSGVQPRGDTPTETPAPEIPAGLSLPQIVTLVWLAGAGASLAYLAAAYAALRRSFRRNAAQPSKKLTALFERVRADMGVSERVRLVCQYGYGTPSLIFPGTIIMPLGALVAMDDEQLTFALRHELVHCRRGDHIVCILLSVLSAAYWFNPFVWAAFRYMRADMETACDSTVVKGLSRDGKRRYASLIVSLFSRPAYGQLVLGMARPGLKKAAERRVKGIFMNGRSKAGAKLGCALLAAVLLLTCFTTACQPTPDDPAVVNKNDGSLEEALQTSPQPPASYKAAEHWSETAANDKLKIVIDTDVFLPGVTEYPVFKLEPAAFSQQRVDELVNYFAQGKRLHLPHVMTKTDYAEWIVNAKRGDLVDGKYVVTQDSLDWVKELEAMQANAPEDSPLVYTDTALTYKHDLQTGEELTDSGTNHLGVAFDNGRGGDATIYVDNVAKGHNSYTSFSYSAGKLAGDVTESMYSGMLEFGGTEQEFGYTGAGALFDKVEITPEQAAAQADSVLSGLGISDLALVNAEKFVTPSAPAQGGYKLEYARSSGGIPVYRFDGGSWFGGEEPAEYSPPFIEETLTARVSKDGLDSLVWMGVASVTETVNGNAPLLPFETIQQRLKEQIYYKKSFMRDDMYSDLTVTVTSAELRMSYIGVKDTAEQALMVPAWVFKTRLSYRDKASGMQQDYADNAYVLSAIDGGVIEYPREPQEYIDADG